jgi:hypothetical protein
VAAQLRAALAVQVLAALLRAALAAQVLAVLLRGNATGKTASAHLLDQLVSYPPTYQSLLTGKMKGDCCILENYLASSSCPPKEKMAYIPPIDHPVLPRKT